MNLIVVPAYGRDYTNAPAVIKDWNEERDFLIMDISSKYDGKYINKQQTAVGDEIKIRYSRRERFVFVPGGPEPVVLTKEQIAEADETWH